jgi:hypothetical protein
VDGRGRGRGLVEEDRWVAIRIDWNDSEHRMSFGPSSLDSVSPGRRRLERSTP